jgi:uncharacterized protein with HEPN domain
MSIDSITRLKHILVETKFLITVSQQIKTVEDLSNDEILKRASVRSIEVIGEAVKALPQSIYQTNNDIPWSKIARMRDNLIHRYFGVDYDIVWNVIVKLVPVLNQKIELILIDIYRQEYIKYKNQVNINQTFSQDYFDKLQQDIAISKLILQEYKQENKNIVISRIKDIVSQSDYILEEPEKLAPQFVEQYINEILKNIVTTQVA